MTRACSKDCFFEKKQQKTLSVLSRRFLQRARNHTRISIIIQAHETLQIATRRRGLTDITAPVAAFLQAASLRTGLLVIWCRHTSASLLVQENADPDVRTDLEAFFARIAPEERGLYIHGAEGPDDMPAHIRAALTQTQLSVPVSGGAMALGTWQGIYLFEHRTRPHLRHIVLHAMGT